MHPPPLVELELLLNLALSTLVIKAEVTISAARLMTFGFWRAGSINRGHSALLMEFTPWGELAFFTDGSFAPSYLQVRESSEIPQGWL